MPSETSKFATPRQKLPLVFGTRKLVFVLGIDATWQRGRRHCSCCLSALSCVSKLTLSKKMCRDIEQIRFHSLLLFESRTLCTVVQEIAPK